MYVEDYFVFLSSSHIQAITEAYLPILKLVYKGIDIDLLCCQVTVPYITSNFDISDDDCVTGIDEKSLLSLNGMKYLNNLFNTLIFLGCRVNEKILSLVPSIPNFKSALRGIKIWAQGNLFKTS